MVVSLFLSRVLGLVRDMVMTGLFGSTGQTDIYRLAFSIPDLLFFLVSGGALSSAFIPVFTEYLHTDREEDAWEIFSTVASVMGTVLIVLVGVCFLLIEPLTRWMHPAVTGVEFQNTVTMTRIVLPTQFAFFVGGLMFGTLYARRVFAVPGLGPNVYNIGILIGAIFLSRFSNPPIAGMSWGALVGAAIGNLLIPFLAMRKLGSRFRYSWNIRHPGVQKVFKLMFPVIFGLSLPGVYDVISRYYGQQYGKGIVTNLTLGNLLMQAPVGVFGQSLALAAFPVLAAHYASQRMDLYRQQLTASMRQVIFITIPISALMAVAPESIVVAIFQHGQFQPEDSIAVAQLLRCFSIGVWAWCLHPVMMRGFFAVQHSVTPILLGTVTTGIYVGLINLFRSMNLGPQGMPMASSASATCLVLMLMFALHNRVGGLDVRSLGMTLGKSLLASVAFVGTTLLILQFDFVASWQTNKLGAILTLMIVCVPGMSLYVAVAKALKMPETDVLDRTLQKLSRRKREEPKVS
jgi:putative peptidoglycan lipid II flippase